MGKVGIGPGPYLFVPLIGPSDTRDLAGFAINSFFDPLIWFRPLAASLAAIEASRTVVGGLDTRAVNDQNLTTLNKTSIDPYAALRSVFLQSRESAIHGNTAVPLENLPDFDTPANP